MTVHPDEARQALGVGPQATPTEVRRAYVALARRFHPDVHAARPEAERRVAERRMRQLNEAMSVLTRSPAAPPGGVPGAGSADERGEPVVRRPASPGWRPRADDTAWMGDFRTWAGEHDELLPDEDSGQPVPRLLAVAPPLLLAVGIVAAVLALALDWRPLLAAAVVIVAAGLTSFAAVPLIVARRGIRSGR